MGFLLWIEESGLGIYIREAAWGFPIALSLHAVGMAMVLGVVIVANLRVLGYATGVPILRYSQLWPWAWFGFAINLASGFALYASHATEYTFQWVFMLKLGLLAVGGILLKLMMDGIRSGWDEPKTKLFAAASLACWVGAVVTGRLMAYF